MRKFRLSVHSFTIITLAVLINSISHALETSGPELSLFVGGAYAPNSINGQRLELLPYEVGPYADSFTDQSGAGDMMWGVQALYRTNILSNYYWIDSWAFGPAFYQSNNLTQTGKVLQFNMAEFENYTYQLNLKNASLFADSELNLRPLYKILFPFIEFGIGIARTNVAYHSLPISPVSDSGLRLDSQINWRFAYQLGGGVKWLVNPDLALSLRYLYADMGTVNSSTTGNTDSLAEPIQVDMRSHNFLLGITYLLP